MERALGHSPPLGLLSLAAYARKHVPGVNITIIDAPAESLAISETVDRIIRSAPAVVGVTITTAAANAAQEIAKEVKKALPDTKLVAGGPHISGAGPSGLSELDAFDLAVAGEGEQTFAELLAALRSRRELGNIAGLMSSTMKGWVQQSPQREPLEDLDQLPFPAWDLLAKFPQAYASNVFFSPGGATATVVTSRGCPFNCAFCDQSTFGHHYRAASAEYVHRIVKTLQEQYKIRYVIFCDDTFTMDRRRVLEICRLLGQLVPRISWSCDANVMTVDREMLKAMKRAGCWSISYGIESGSPTVLKSLNKNIRLDRARDVIRQTHSEAIRAKGLFILGTPEESLDSVSQTRDFMDSVPLSTINLSKFTPYPGSELHKQVGGDCQVDSNRLNGMHFVMPSKYLSIAELEKHYSDLIRRFYTKMRSGRVHLPIMFGNWDNFRRLVSIVPHALRAKIRRHPAKKSV